MTRRYGRLRTEETVEYAGHHRGDRIQAWVHVAVLEPDATTLDDVDEFTNEFTNEWTIDGIDVGIVKVNDVWLIIAASVSDDDVWTDIGPFDTPEAAWTALRIMEAAQ